MQQIKKGKCENRHLVGNFSDLVQNLSGEGFGAPPCVDLWVRVGWLGGYIPTLRKGAKDGAPVHSGRVKENGKEVVGQFEKECTSAAKAARQMLDLRHG